MPNALQFDMADKDEEHSSSEWSPEEYEGHFKNALSNSLGVLSAFDRFPKPDPNRTIPENWQSDPLLLLGEYLDLLNMSEEEKREYRASTRRFVEERSVDYVWGIRAWFAAEIEFLRTF